MATETDELEEQRERFELCVDAESDNRAEALDDLRFARLSQQWPANIEKQRRAEGRPVLTINRMPSFIRQVVNDSRQNKPQIKVKPVDDSADKKTAIVYEGLIRNIEYQSKADIVYDTAVDFAASCGFGYIRVAIDYEYDDSFDKGLRIQRVANPFSVYGDPFSTQADSSDWNMAFVTEYMTDQEFKAKYKGAEKTSWEDIYSDQKAPWRQDNEILTCEAWSREKTKRKILLLSNKQIVGAKEYETNRMAFDAQGITVDNERDSLAYKITQRIMTGAEILETNEWAGQYIPIIPVYGEELNIEGKRYFRSLIRDAKDAQRMFNFWRTNSTELVALAPRVPFIGHESAFAADPNWATANTASHPYLMVKDGKEIPQRQPMDNGKAVGSMSEALMASDDMKSIIGMYDASLGQKSNETSGVAINARKNEGDVSTFHFIDNLARGIRHTACVLIDLIPKVYTGERIIRVLGDDGKEAIKKIGQQPPGQTPPQQAPQAPVMPGQPQPDDTDHVYDLAVGKYDVAVDTGLGYTTQRAETVAQMGEFLRAFPQAAPFIGDLMVKNTDWKNADEIADRLKAMIPSQATGGPPPEIQKMIQEGQKHIQDLEQQVQQLTSENLQIKGKVANDGAKAATDQKKTNIEGYKAETDRLTALLPFMTPQALNALGLQNAQDALNTPDPVQEHPEKHAPVSINIPDNIGSAIADTLGPALHAAVSGGMSQALAAHKPPPPPSMKRTPVRDKSGMILHTIDAPIQTPA